MIIQPIVKPQLSLYNRLVSFWKLEEASGTRADAVPVGLSNLKTAVNDLTANNAPGNTTGVSANTGNAVALVLASSQSLSISSNTSIRMGSGVRCTWAFWVNFTTVATNQVLITKQAGGPTDEYRINLSITAIGGTSPGIQWAVSSAGTTYNATVTASNFGAVTTGTWYFVVCQYNGSNISISINNGTPNTTSFSADIFSGTTPLYFGQSNLITPNYMNGALDAVGLWKRALASEEITYLYNSGSGRQFPFAT